MVISSLLTTRWKLQVFIRKETLHKMQYTCFHYSDLWLKSIKRNNANESLVSDQFVQDLILNTPPVDSKRAKTILGQTFAYEDSPFLRWTNSTDVRRLTFQLVFLAIHHHQHSPAKNEALARQNGKINKQYLESNEIGPYDYQCDPNTKFLVHEFFVNRIGFAASLLQLVNLYYAGLSSGRVVYISNHRRGNNLVACSRNDLQCNFLPDTPCVLSIPDWENRTKIDGGQFKALLENGTINENEDRKKILQFDAPNSISGISTSNLQEKVVDLVKKMFHEQSSFDLEKVYDEIRNQKWLISTVIWGYMLRPNLKTKFKIDSILENMTKGLYPESTMGLAIRASDKCLRESRCMSFNHYMELMEKLSWKRTLEKNKTSSLDVPRSRNLYDTIILTTEDKAIKTAYNNFKVQNATFPFKIIMNEQDPMQGHGSSMHFRGKTEEVLISSLVAVRLQLFADTVVINGKFTR